MVRAARDPAVDYPPVQFAGGGPPFDDERALVEAARTDAAAFAQLYRHYVPKIHAFAFRRTNSTALAEDITAATFERVYRELDRFEWRGGGFGAWVYRIATNEVIDHYRRQNRSQSDRGQAALGALHISVSEDDVDHIDDGGAEVRRLLASLSTLNPRYQEAISLRFLSELTPEKAADAMGVTKPVMSVTLSRALSALRKAMHDAPGMEA